MNWKILLSCLFAGVIFFPPGHASAGFIIDGFTAPPTPAYASNGSFGKVEDNADALGGQRGFNITALFNSNVTLLINGGRQVIQLSQPGLPPPPRSRCGIPIPRPPTRSPWLTKRSPSATSPPTQIGICSSRSRGMGPYHQVPPSALSGRVTTVMS